MTQIRQQTSASRRTADQRTIDRNTEEETFDEDVLTDDEDPTPKAEEETIIPALTPQSLSAPTDSADDICLELAELQDANSTDQSSPKRATRRRYFASLLSVTFQRVVCDEGHRVKTISSRQHQSIAKLVEQTSGFPWVSIPALDRDAHHTAGSRG